MFNCIFSKSKGANSKMVIVTLLRSYCLPFMLYALEARVFNPGIPNPGIPAHFLNPESRDWRCSNPGISGL